MFKSWFVFSFDESSKLSKTSGLLLKINTVPIAEKKNIYKKNCKNVYSIVQLLVKEWGEKKQKIVIKKNKKFHESKLLSVNIEKAKKELLWEPKLSLNETIKFTIDWYKYYFFEDNVEDISKYQIDYYTDK